MQNDNTHIFSKIFFTKTTTEKRQFWGTPSGSKPAFACRPALRSRQNQAFLIIFRRFLLISGKKSLKKLWNEQKRLKTAEKKYNTPLCNVFISFTFLFLIKINFLYYRKTLPTRDLISGPVVRRWVFLNPNYPLPSESGGVYVSITLCTLARERPFLSFILCVSAQVAPPLSPIGGSH